MASDTVDRIDRASPATRPSGRNAGTQRWRDLLFVHWPVDEESLRAAVPPELELDSFGGRYYVGVVPFLMRDIRAAWMPSFTAMNFLETNLRTYVVYDGRPGVWFFSLEASSRLAVSVARAVWKLPYHHANMHASRDGQRIQYESVRRDASGAELSVDFEVGAALGASEPGTLEYFLLERYLLFSKRGERVFEGQVHHPPYVAHEARLRSLTESLVDVAGITKLRGADPLVHYSGGVDVEVFGPWALPPLD
ncbi:MAG: YqjF family protein [Polyangiales bacterium]